jgi:arylsulfatase
MTWKGVIHEGVVCNNISSALDILPTITEITGANLTKRKIDGISLWKLLNGDSTNQPRDTFLYYYRVNNLEAVRFGKWKLVFPHPGRTYEVYSRERWKTWSSK